MRFPAQLANAIAEAFEDRDRDIDALSERVKKLEAKCEYLSGFAKGVQERIDDGNPDGGIRLVLSGEMATEAIRLRDKYRDNDGYRVSTKKPEEES